MPERGAVNDTPTIRPAPTDAGTARRQPLSGKININICAEEELLTLPGIGPVLARSIVDHREKNGPFGGIEELRYVSGIGEKRFEAIREYIVIADF